MTAERLLFASVHGSLKHEVNLISFLSRGGEAPGLNVLSCDIPFKWIEPILLEFVDGPKLKNPYDTNQQNHVECSASVPNSDVMIGKIIYDTYGGAGGLKVTICLKTPCNNPSNRFTDTFKINNQF